MSKWATESGFRFNADKSTCFIFQAATHQSGAVHYAQWKPNPKWKDEMETKVLGISLYKEFTFVPHIQQLKMKCVQSLNIHKVQSHQSYGRDRTSLLKRFRSLIFSKIDYGRIVYQSASVGRCSLSFTDSGQLQVLCARVPLRVFMWSLTCGPQNTSVNSLRSCTPLKSPHYFSIHVTH